MANLSLQINARGTNVSAQRRDNNVVVDIDNTATAEATVRAREAAEEARTEASRAAGAIADFDAAASAKFTELDEISQQTVAAVASKAPRVFAATGTPTPRAIEDRAADSINVEDFRVDPATGLPRNDDETLRAACAAGVNREIKLGARTYLLTGPEIPLVGNFHLRGCGKGISVLKVDPANSAKNGIVFSDGTGNRVRFSDLTFEGNWENYNSELGPSLCVLKSISHVEFERVGFRYSRGFSLTIRFADFVSVRGCTFEFSNRDMCALWGCSYAIVDNCFFNGGMDDSVSAHVNSDDPGPLRSMVSVTNCTFVDTHGTSFLGPKNITVNNCRFFRCKSQAVGIGGIVAGAQGETAGFAVEISDLLISDSLGRQWFEDGSQTSRPFAGPLLRALPLRSGELAAPPTYAAGGAVIPELGLLYDNRIVAESRPCPPMMGVRLSNITIRRTLPAVSAYTAWGYGKAFGGAHGWLDYAVSDANLEGYGVELRAPLSDCTITNLNCYRVANGLRFTRSSGQDAADNLFRNVRVLDSSFRANRQGAVLYYGETALTRQDITFDRCLFDVDPYFQHESRAVDGNGSFTGAWVAGASSAGPWAIRAPFVGGFKVKNSTFANVAVLIDDSSSGTGALNTYERNLLRCEPAFTSFNISNKGIGQVRIPGDAWWVEVVSSDPRNPGYGAILNTCLREAAALPTSGVYVQGMELRVASPVRDPGGYALPWRRLTTGSAHVVGVDWMQGWAGFGSGESGYVSSLRFRSSGGSTPQIEAVSTSANANVTLTPKGTGRVQFGVVTPTADTPITGYVEILDAAGNVIRLAKL